MHESSERFPVVRWHEGYDVAEVDRFVAWLERELTTAGSTSDVARTIREMRFTPRGIRRSYDMLAVDEFLDEQLVRAEARGR